MAEHILSSNLPLLSKPLESTIRGADGSLTLMVSLPIADHGGPEVCEYLRRQKRIDYRKDYRNDTYTWLFSTFTPGKRNCVELSGNVFD